jgi:hypothetical protein
MQEMKHELAAISSALAALGVQKKGGKPKCSACHFQQLYPFQEQYPVSIAPNYECIITNSLVASSLILVCVYLPTFLILSLGDFWVFYPF